MSKWVRKFEVSAPVERVWEALQEPEEANLLFGSHVRPEVTEPGRALAWSQDLERLPDRAEFTVVLEATDHGSRITLTRSSFGEGDDADIFHQSQRDGWVRGVMDLVLYVETGARARRLKPEGGPGRTGIGFMETDSGLTVKTVLAGSFGEEAGLRAGDRLTRIGGAPVFSRGDVWMLNTLAKPGDEVEVEFVRDGAIRTSVGKLSGREISAWGE